jgi:hypothetical protein
VSKTPTAPQITKANCLHLEQKQIFQTYHAVDKALRNQILEAVPDVYVCSLRSLVTGYGNITSLQLLEHLLTKYGAITQAELYANEACMTLPWNPPIPILFKQLEDGIDFARAGKEIIALNQVLRLGYNNVHKTGLFTVTCHEWCQTDPATRTMDDFQDHFGVADTDRINNSTTGELGYHSPAANIIIPHSNDATFTASANATLVAKDAQIERLLAAMQHMTPPGGSVYSAITSAETVGTNRSNGTPTSYCWTHGHSKIACSIRL